VNGDLLCTAVCACDGLKKHLIVNEVWPVIFINVIVNNKTRAYILESKFIDAAAAPPHKKQYV